MSVFVGCSTSKTYLRCGILRKDTTPPEFCAYSFFFLNLNLNGHLKWTSLDQFEGACGELQLFRDHHT